jgi:hypothetical protein
MVRALDIGVIALLGPWIRPNVTLPRLDSTRVTYDRTFCMPRGLSGYPTKGKTIHNRISDVRYFRLPGQFDLGLPPACLDYASLGLP